MLVVDDNVDAAETLALLLEASGHDVRTAYDGPTAVEAALDYRPNVVLLDIGLPGLDGFEVAKRLRQQPALESVVLVAMTGYGQESDRQRSQDAGFDHHLVKPASFGKVQQILATVSDERPDATNGAKRRDGRKAMPTTEKIFEFSLLMTIETAPTPLGLVVEALGNQVHVTYGGAQALDVATAFRPDLMLVDLAMPEMDGCVLVKRFRQIPAFARTKIVAITGHADEGHKTLAMKAGFDAVLFKPVALKKSKRCWPASSCAQTEHSHQSSDGAGRSRNTGDG